MLVLLAAPGLFGALKDAPFLQDVSVKFGLHPELQGAEFRRVAVDRDGIVYVLTDRGLARLFEATLALDKSFRPLAGRKPLDITLHEGGLYYLDADQFLSNDRAGKPFGQLPNGLYQRFAAAEDGALLLSGERGAALFRDGNLLPLQPARGISPGRPYAWRNDFYLAGEDRIYRVMGTNVALFHQGSNITALAFRKDEIFLGTRQGYYALNATSERPTLLLQTKLPVPHITCLWPAAEGVWAGTTRGVFHHGNDGRIAYYASKRWLPDDEVADLALDAQGNVLVLTRTGLTKIEFRPMTLAEKAAYYDRKIRQRHIRFGFCAELRLRTPGDISSAEMIDTDNDGTWSNYYMASQAFRYGATGREEARRYAWETFAALERLESINGLDGFPARTFERAGFKFSDPERWHRAPDTNWEWKAHTSSDEVTAHTFGCAVMSETVAKTAAEKARLARFYDKIMSHIVRNNFYLIDVDGRPTLWGRWNPEYVNWYPHSIGDRRLNSAELIAMLQFAYKITGKEIYRDKAFDLLHHHGYLENILSSMKRIAPTPGFIHLGNDMGSEWNHSDDLLAFVTYWVLYRYAFNDELKRKFAATIKDHFELEKHECCPLWNFVYASTGARDYGPEGALWTLRKFPLDLVDWQMANSHRHDLTKLPSNFRGQQMAELLPPGERRVTRWNGHPFVLDGGSGGHLELAGDEFLLPYWMGRYLRVIQAPR